MARKMTFADWLDTPPHTQVRALRRIEDCPASRQDDSVPRGTIGEIDDYDSCGMAGDGSQGVLIVSFEGDRVLIVDPYEIEPIPVRRR